MTNDAAPDTPLLQVEAITKTFGGFTALDNISVDIRKGERFGLIGPNGSGKTTLFECLAGVLAPTSGELLYQGRLLSARERRGVLFYLPDGIAPWPEQTVQWALEFTVGFLGGLQDQLGAVIESLTLAPLLMSPIGTLSKGQRKRVLLAIGLLTAQPLLLADEPFEGLDLRQSREVAATLRAHSRGGRTLFLSIHQIADAARICDRFVLLSGGKVRGEGTLDELTAVARSAGAGTVGNLEEVFLALT